MRIRFLNTLCTPAVKAFTLAELLIALLILSTISTFTIPKVIQVQSNTKYNAIAKEAAGTVSNAYMAYQQGGGTIQAFSTPKIIPYLNYVKVLTDGSLVDGVGAGQQEVCDGSGGFYCLKLHNGAILYFWDMSFCNSTDKSGIWYRMDPDGIPDNKIMAPTIYLYTNGRLTSIDGVDNPTRWGYGWPSCVDYSIPDPGSNQPWFKW